MPGPQPRHYHPFIVGRGLDPSAGRRGRRPLQHNPQGFSLPQTSAAAWGQAALHPTLPHSVGRAFARNSFTPPCRGRACPARSLAITTPFILCIVGRGLDRLTAHNERRQPAKLARSCGCLPCRGKHCSLPDFAPLNRGPTLTTPHLRGASGTPPLTTQSAGLLITANVRGGLGAGRPTSHFTIFRGAGLRPQLIHATLPLPPRILCIVGRQTTGPLHNRPAPSNTKTTCLRPLAGRLFFAF